MNKSYKIYLDVCCLNRTLDDLEQTRIRLEAEAVTEIIQHFEDGEWILINSDIIAFEVSQKKFTIGSKITDYRYQIKSLGSFQPSNSIARLRGMKSNPCLSRLHKRGSRDRSGGRTKF